LLNAALAQTRWKGPAMTPTNWRRELRHKLAQLDWEKARGDVRPFLEQPRDLELVSIETLAKLLRQTGGRLGE